MRQVSGIGGNSLNHTPSGPDILSFRNAIVPGLLDLVFCELERLQLLKNFIGIFSKLLIHRSCYYIFDSIIQPPVLNESVQYGNSLGIEAIDGLVAMDNSEFLDVLRSPNDMVPANVIEQECRQAEGG